MNAHKIIKELLGIELEIRDLISYICEAEIEDIANKDQIREINKER